MSLGRTATFNERGERHDDPGLDGGDGVQVDVCKDVLSFKIDDDVVCEVEAGIGMWAGFAFYAERDTDRGGLRSFVVDVCPCHALLAFTTMLDVTEHDVSLLTGDFFVRAVAWAIDRGHVTTDEARAMRDGLALADKRGTVARYEAS